MASKKISQFEELLTPSLTSVLPIVDQGTTQKVSYSTILQQASALAKAFTESYVENFTTLIQTQSADWTESPSRRFDFVVSQDFNTAYSGLGAPNASESEEVWKITKNVFTSTGSLSTSQILENQQWTNRLSLF